jgi:hypothetical protein
MAERPLFQTSLTDPTFLFGLSCLFSVIFVSGEPETNSTHGGTLSLRPLSTIPSVLFDYVLDPVFFIGLVREVFTRVVPPVPGPCRFHPSAGVCDTLRASVVVFTVGAQRHTRFLNSVVKQVVLLVLRHFVGDNAKPLSASEDRRAGWYVLPKATQNQNITLVVCRLSG